MKWIKASERMPDERGRYFIKTQFHPNSVIGKGAAMFDPEPIYSGTNWDSEDIIEWLDESPAFADGWVRVEDGLPDKAKPVLLYTGYWTGVGYYMFNYELEIDDEPKWSEETGEYIGATVTHWMPLPQPPKTVEP